MTSLDTKKKNGREDQSCPWSWLELRSRIYHVSYKKIRVIYHVREDQSWSRIYHVSYISSSLPGYIMVGKIRVARVKVLHVSYIMYERFNLKRPSSEIQLSISLCIWLSKRSRMDKLV